MSGPKLIEAQDYFNTGLSSILQQDSLHLQRITHANLFALTSITCHNVVDHLKPQSQAKAIDFSYEVAANITAVCEIRCNFW